MRNKNVKVLVILISFLILIALITTSCGENAVSANPGEYSVFNFSEDDVRLKLKGTLIHEHPLFTLEYPSSFMYNYDEDEILLNMRITLVNFERQLEGFDKSFPKTNLSVSVHEPGLWNDTNSKTAIDNIIIYHSSDQEFNIIERTSTCVAGFNAELLSYSYHQPVREVFGSTPIPEYNGVVKIVCFDYQELIWRVCLNCLDQEFPETEIYFQHTLDTFQIIE
jgi:hypothetical protein